MIHLLERSLIDLSELIKKETGNEYLSDIASQLATWSTHYIPFDQSHDFIPLKESYKDADSAFSKLAYELDERLRNK
jgi:hypothetical protein